MSPVYKNNPDFYRHHMDIEEARERNSAPAFEIRAELYVYCICSTLDNLAGSCSAVHTLHTTVGKGEREEEQRKTSEYPESCWAAGVRLSWAAASTAAAARTYVFRSADGSWFIALGQAHKWTRQPRSYTHRVRAAVLCVVLLCMYVVRYFELENMFLFHTI